MAKKDVVNEFTKIKGVGKAKAELLYDSGFDSIDKLKKATIKDLTKIEGITDANAKSIKAEYREKTKTGSEKAPKEKKIETKKPNEQEKIDTKKEKKQEKPKEQVKEKEPEEKDIKEEKKEEKYQVKKKPKLTKDLEKSLRIRKQIKKRTPEFLREEWFRYKRVPRNWRRPDGITSKMRINLKYRPSKVRVGFRGPKDARGLHSSGFKEIIIYNVNDLKAIDPNTQAARIGKTVGTKKRIDIEKKAQELEIRILNM